MPIGGKREGAGRKTMEEEALNIIKKRNAEELANDLITGHLGLTKKDDRQGVKEIALPVYLKSKADIKEHKGKVTIETITGMEISKDED